MVFSVVWMGVRFMGRLLEALVGLIDIDLSLCWDFLLFDAFEPTLMFDLLLLLEAFLCTWD